MKKGGLVSGCACCRMNRRRFLAAGCAACAGAAGLLPSPGEVSAAWVGGKMKIRIIYSLHAAQQAVPDWPNKGFDFRPVMERINTGLAQACRGFEFVS